MTRLKFLREYAKRFPPSGMTARSNIIKPWWPVPSSSGMPAPVFYRGPGDRLAQPPKSTSEIPPHSHETTTECHDRPLFWPPADCSCFGCANFFEIEMFQNNSKPPSAFRYPVSLGLWRHVRRHNGVTMASRFPAFLTEHSPLSVFGDSCCQVEWQIQECVGFAGDRGDFFDG